MSRPTALLLSLVLLAGCASTTGARSPWSAASEHDELERRLLALERQATRDRLEIERLQRRVAELESTGTGRAARSVAAPSRPAVAAPVPPAPPANDAPATVAPAPETLTPAPSVGPGLSPTIEESELEEAVIAAPPSPAGASYESGLRLLRDGQPEAAERELQAFALAHPDSDLADNAWFWTGESRFARGDAAGALEAYREAIDRYPEGNKVPDALLKLGAALEATGERESAREAWSELVRRFPDTVAADRARSELASR